MIEHLLSANLHDALIVSVPFLGYCSLVALTLWLLELRQHNRALARNLGITLILFLLAGLTLWLR